MTVGALTLNLTKLSLDAVTHITAAAHTTAWLSINSGFASIPCQLAHHLHLFDLHIIEDKLWPLHLKPTLCAMMPHMTTSYNTGTLKHLIAQPNTLPAIIYGLNATCLHLNPIALQLWLDSI